MPGRPTLYTEHVSIMVTPETRAYIDAVMERDDLYMSEVTRDLIERGIAAKEGIDVEGPEAVKARAEAIDLEPRIDEDVLA